MYIFRYWNFFPKWKKQQQHTNKQDKTTKIAIFNSWTSRKVSNPKLKNKRNRFISVCSFFELRNLVNVINFRNYYTVLPDDKCIIEGKRTACNPPPADTKRCWRRMKYLNYGARRIQNIIDIRRARSDGALNIMNSALNIHFNFQWTENVNPVGRHAK